MLRLTDNIEAEVLTVTACRLIKWGTSELEACALANVITLEPDASDAVVEQRVIGSDHPRTLESMSNLALCLAREGHYDEAENLLRETLEVQRRVFGPENPNPALSIYRLGCIAALKGNRDAALSLLREAIDHGLVSS